MLAYLMVSESVKYIIQVSVLLFVHEIAFSKLSSQNTDEKINYDCTFYIFPAVLGI